MSKSIRQSGGPLRILLAVIILALAAACSDTGGGENKPAETAAEKPGQAAKAEKAITVSWMRDLGPSNPHAYYPNQLFAQSMIYEPLVAYGKGGEIKPHLAQSWAISEDGKEYTFRLRTDVKYSDGTPFNAANVKRNIDAILLQKSTHSWLGIAKVLESAEVVDEHTVKLKLSEPYYPALQDLTTVRPFRFLADAGFPDDGDTLKSIKQPIGTGPWRLEEYKQDEYAVFVRNPDYWGEAPKLDKVTVRITPDAETRVLAFEKGELDLIFGEGSISLDAFTGLRDSGKYKTDLSGPLGTRNLVLNTQNGKLVDRRVRLALHHGFDRQALVKGITSDVEDPASQVLSTDYPYVHHNFEPAAYDPELSVRYLEEAGWLLPSGGSVREKNGEPLALELMYDTTDRIQKAMGEVLQAEWANIGVKVELVGLELTEQTKRLRAGDYDLDFWFNSGVPYDPHTLVNAVAEPSFGISEAHTNIPGKDALNGQIRAVLSSTDEKRRQELYDGVFQTIQEQSVIIPLSYIKQYVVYHDRLKGVGFPDSRWDHPFNSIDISE